MTLETIRAGSERPSQTDQGEPRPAPPHGRTLTLDRAVMMFAGAMVLASVALTVWVHPGWVWLTVFVGLNLTQASVTGFCPAARLFRRLGVRPGTAFR